jgi:hypothetical protein
LNATNNQKIFTDTSFSLHYLPPLPQSKYFVETLFAAITAASLLEYVSISLAHLATGIFFPFFKAKLLQLLQVVRIF